ncbi:MAG: hypothetical protein AB7E52_06340 [Bdellovibrionales bacterium]
MMFLSTTPLEEAETILRMQAEANLITRQPLLTGKKYVASSHNDHWRHTDQYGLDNEIVNHIDVYCAAPLYFGYLSRAFTRYDDKGKIISHLRRLELQQDDVFSSLVRVSFPNPRYNEIKIEFPAPVCCAPIPPDLRKRPPYLSTGKDLFVAYACDSMTARTNGAQGTAHLLFATKFIYWQNTVKPSRELQELSAAVNSTNSISVFIP